MQTDIFNLIQNSQDTKYQSSSEVEEEPKISRGPQQRSERQVGRERSSTYTCHNATTRLLHDTNSKSANKSPAKA